MSDPTPDPIETISDSQPAQASELASADPAPPALPPPPEADAWPSRAEIEIVENVRDRVLAMRPTSQRDAVLANLDAGAYTRDEDIEADIADLERRDAHSAEPSAE